jgi:AcrR family transcriptional regulator
MPDSRTRILDAAWALVRAQGTTGAVTMAAVAEAAGVSRQLVYIRFTSRAGLLTAMARDHDRRSGFAARVAATRELPPAAGLEQLVREWLAYVPEILPVARALEAASITGEDGAEAWRDRMDDLHSQFALAIGRLAAAGLLAPGWTTESATDWAWARAHLTGWQHLVRERGWDAKDYAQRCAQSVVSELVSTGSARSARG